MNKSGLPWSTCHLLPHGLDKTHLMEPPSQHQGAQTETNPFTEQTKVKRKPTGKLSNYEETLPGPSPVPDDEERVLPDFAGHVEEGVGTGWGKNGTWEQSRLRRTACLLLLHLVIFPSFVYSACLWLCHSMNVLDCISLLFPNKPIFAGKITFLFKVNTCLQLTHANGLQSGQGTPEAFPFFYCKVLPLLCLPFISVSAKTQALNK